MLKVEHISHVKVDKDSMEYKNEWRKARLAKFTSSMMFTQMDDKPFTVGAMSYILERVGEELSGVPAKYEVDTFSTRWGLINEADGTRKFGEYLGETFLVTQSLITAPGSRFGSTPDCIRVIKDYGDHHDVESGEVKCYPSYPHYIRCVLCNTPKEIKEVDKKLYWQVLDQMDNLDCMNGWAVFYHPDLKVGGFKVIKFRKIELIEDFKFLKIRKVMAEQKFEEIRDKMINLKN